MLRTRNRLHSLHIEASTIETINTIHSGKSSEISSCVDTVSEDNASYLIDCYSYDIVHHDMHDPGFFPTENIFPNCSHNEMLSHYNHILIGCFKDIFQSVDTNNLAAVSQALKELNFMLANRAPELAAHHSIPLEPQQVSANTTKDSSRGRPRTRGNQHNIYTRQSPSVPRYNQQSHRSDIHSYSNTDRSYNQTSYNNRNRCHLHSSLNHSCNAPNNSYHNNSNMQCNIDMHSSNTSDILGSLQSQILVLQTHQLQQSTLNCIKIFEEATKWNLQLGWQSIENTAKVYHLDVLSIALSKLQGALLKSANYLETKETNACKALIWVYLTDHKVIPI